MIQQRFTVKISTLQKNYRENRERIYLLESHHAIFDKWILDKMNFCAPN